MSKGPRCPTEAIESYRRIKRPLSVSFRELVPMGAYPNVLTHQLHPYPAKLLGHIPRWLLLDSEWSGVNGSLLDPFCGSGTVLLEGARLRRTLVGADINPVARLITEVKLSPPSTGGALRAVERVLKNARAGAEVDVPEVVNIDHWYSKGAIAALGALRGAILQEPSGRAKQFLWLVFSRTVRTLSHADPRLTVPVRRTSRSPRRSSARNRALETFERYAHESIARIEQYDEELTRREVRLTLFRDASDLRLERNSVGTLITSPPYAAAQKYIRATSLSACWIGLASPNELSALKRASIGNETISRSEWDQEIDNVSPFMAPFIRRVANISKERAAITAKYVNQMQRFWELQPEHLQREGVVAMVVAENSVCGLQFPAVELAKYFASGVGLKLECELVDRIRGRSLLTSRNGDTAAMDFETVLMWRNCGTG